VVPFPWIRYPGEKVRFYPPHVSTGETMRTRRLIIFILFCTLGLGLWLLLWFVPTGYTRIDLTEGDKERNLLSAVLPDGDRLTLTWRNSQFGLDVTESFFARSGVIVQESVTFAAPEGAPPPQVRAEDVDDLFHTGGAFDARGLSRPLERIVYRIGEIGRPRLQVRDRRIAFKEEAGFGGRIVLSASRPSLHEILLYR